MIVFQQSLFEWLLPGHLLWHADFEDLRFVWAIKSNLSLDQFQMNLVEPLKDLSITESDLDGKSNCCQ